MANELVREMNVKRVLHEAMRLFAEKGVEKTTIAMIGKAAGVTDRSVMNYFASKYDIVEAVLNMTLSRLYNELEEHISDSDYQQLNGLDQVLNMIRYLLTSLKHNCDYFTSLTEMESMLSRAGRLDPAEYYNNRLTRMASYMETAMRKGTMDGSIRRKHEDEKHLYVTMAFLLRGAQRQLASIYMSAADQASIDTEEIINDYVLSVKHNLGA